MPVIAVVNRKGGSGKSTLATHIAAYCANAGIGVMLGDVDRQQSTRSWLKLREQRQPPLKSILGWAVNQTSSLRAPTGVSHVVLDTPGGLFGLDLARVVMFADVVVMPLCNSVFDRESAAQCFDELKTFPRIATGRCKLAVVGMRINDRIIDSAVLTQWATERQLPFLGSLRNSPTYVACIESGITIFDMPKETVSQDLAQWQPILDWLQPTVFPAPKIRDDDIQRSVLSSYTSKNSARIDRLQPPQQSLIPGERMAAQLSAEPAQQVNWNKPEKSGSKTSLMDSLGLPNFLRRK